MKIDFCFLLTIVRPIKTSKLTSRKKLRPKRFKQVVFSNLIGWYSNYSWIAKWALSGGWRGLGAQPTICVSVNGHSLGFIVLSLLRKTMRWQADTHEISNWTKGFGVSTKTPAKRSMKLSVECRLACILKETKTFPHFSGSAWAR